jgi:hypothetical protein
MKFVFKLFLIMLISKITTGQAWYFEFKSEGTYYPYCILVSFTSEGKVTYIKTNIHTQKVYEKWEGKIEKEDMEAFVKELINQCRFFDLPVSSGEPIRVKDSSYEYFTLIYREKKHTVGGYDASHDNVYDKIYEAYNTLWGKIKNINVKVKTQNINR